MPKRPLKFRSAWPSSRRDVERTLRTLGSPEWKCVASCLLTGGKVHDLLAAFGFVEAHKHTWFQPLTHFFTGFLSSGVEGFEAKSIEDYFKEQCMATMPTCKRSRTMLMWNVDNTLCVPDKWHGLRWQSIRFRPIAQFSHVCGHTLTKVRWFLKKSARSGKHWLQLKVKRLSSWLELRSADGLSVNDGIFR